MTPYAFGGDRVEGRSEGPWDCIGWVMECFDAADIDVDPDHEQGYTNAERARQAGIRISENEAQPGDLVYFERTYNTSGASHVGIVWDPVNKIMADDHQRADGTGPGLTSWDDPYWRNRLLDFRRVRRPFERAAALNYWTLEEVGAAANVAAYPNVADNWPGICRAASLWGIDDPLVMIGMIGTIAKETSSFYPLREAWWVWDKNPEFAKSYYKDTSLHAAYEGGSGWEYHGRGYVQTTHIGNYQRVQDEIKRFEIEVDLVGNPDLLLEAEYAAHALCIYFLTHPYPPGGMVQACRERRWSEVRKAVYGRLDPDGAAKIQRAESFLLPLAQARGYA